VKLAFTWRAVVVFHVGHGWNRADQDCGHRGAAGATDALRGEPVAGDCPAATGETTGPSMSAGAEPHGSQRSNGIRTGWRPFNRSSSAILRISPARRLCRQSLCWSRGRKQKTKPEVITPGRKSYLDFLRPSLVTWRWSVDFRATAARAGNIFPRSLDNKSTLWIMYACTLSAMRAYPSRTPCQLSAKSEATQREPGRRTPDCHHRGTVGACQQLPKLV